MVCDKSPESMFLEPTGGLRPPLLVQSGRLPAKNDFCDARTHMHKSGGREPAVGVHWVERSAWCAANHLQARFSNHGGLTPPALGAVRTFAGEKRFLRCTNAH
jgi:hypothetical protein